MLSPNHWKGVVARYPDSGQEQSGPVPQPSPGTQQFCLNSVFLPLCVPLHCPKRTTVRRILKTRGDKRAFVLFPHFPFSGSERDWSFCLSPRWFICPRSPTWQEPSGQHCPCVPAEARYQRGHKITLPALKNCCRKHSVYLAVFY